MNKKIEIASIVLAALFIGIVAIMTIDCAYATSKSTETTTQENSLKYMIIGYFQYYYCLPILKVFHTTVK
jgi:hypothetical protein